MTEMINCPFCCKVEYDAATNQACPGCGVSLYKDVTEAEMEARGIKQHLDAIKYGWVKAVDIALSYVGESNVAEDYCPTCGRPDGAGHEPKCLDTKP